MQFFGGFLSANVVAIYADEFAGDASSLFIYH